MTQSQKEERLKDKRDYLQVLQNKRTINADRIEVVTQDIAKLEAIQPSD